MYAERYGKAGIKPGSLSVAIGLNGAILAALIFSAPEIIKIPDGGIKIWDVQPDVEPPPPVPVEPITPKVDTKVVQPTPQDQVVTPDPVVLTGAATTDFVTKATIDPVAPPGTGGTGTIIEPVHIPSLTGATRDPRYAGVFQPTYPAVERRAGNEGRVVVRVLIGTDGRVRQVEKISAASDAFFDVTERQALNKWRFKPATRDGVPQESWQILSVSFRLDEED